ncbi:MAG TPA: hypothetical protein VIF60_08660 [Burkholderiaceae bacterium]|jgi:hypothetical protein
MNHPLHRPEPQKSEPALSDSFIDWWFSPWSYAGDEGQSDGPASALSTLTSSDMLARRDAYRLWCAELKVAADLPPHFDPAWSIVATSEPQEFAATLRLFGAVIAACGRDELLLGELPFDDRRWCMSIASTQALTTAPRPAASLAERGAQELKDRLDAGFYGIWSRLRLLLSPPLRVAVDRQTNESSRAPLAAGAVARGQRCWRLCRERAGTASHISR